MYSSQKHTYIKKNNGSSHILMTLHEQKLGVIINLESCQKRKKKDENIGYYIPASASQVALSTRTFFHKEPLQNLLPYC